MKIHFLLLIGVSIFTGCTHVAKDIRKTNTETLQTPLPITQEETSVLNSDQVSDIPNQQEEKLIALPLKLELSVPFTSQAPQALWDELHNEACEEASMIMADAYFRKKPLTKESGEAQIQALVAWETENGYTVDITAQEVVDILKHYYSLNTEISSLVETENIQAQLNKDKLVIIPAAGRLLGNPYYRQPGPLYHMLVIRGYDAKRKEFITNDPGTRRGEGYRYKYDVLLNAVHDWPQQGKGKDDVTEEDMNAGRKVMIVVESNQ